MPPPFTEACPLPWKCNEIRVRFTLFCHKIRVRSSLPCFPASLLPLDARRRPFPSLPLHQWPRQPFIGRDHVERLALQGDFVPLAVGHQRHAGAPRRPKEPRCFSKLAHFTALFFKNSAVPMSPPPRLPPFFALVQGLTRTHRRGDGPAPPDRKAGRAAGRGGADHRRRDRWSPDRREGPH